MLLLLLPCCSFRLVQLTQLVAAVQFARPVAATWFAFATPVAASQLQAAVLQLQAAAHLSAATQLQAAVHLSATAVPQHATAAMASQLAQTAPKVAKTPVLLKTLQSQKKPNCFEWLSELIRTSEIGLLSVRPEEGFFCLAQLAERILCRCQNVRSDGFDTANATVAGNADYLPVR